MTDQPSVARMVHYVSHGSPVLPDGTQRYTSRCRAAVVTDTCTGGPGHDDCSSLAVLNPTGLFFDEHVAHDPGTRPVGGPATGLCDGLHHDGGTWHWPARV